MDSTNNAGNGFTDEQWESLLNQTFAEPITPINTPESPIAEPEENTEQLEDVPTALPKVVKHRKLTTGFKILLGICAALLIAIVCILLPDRKDTTKEFKQCWEALQQWQSTESYKMDISVRIIPSASHMGIINQAGTISTYYHSAESNLLWDWIRANNLQTFSGRAQIGDQWLSYSGSSLHSQLWTTTQDKTPIPAPWILSYSLEEVDILHQQVHLDEQYGITTITFAIMDKKQDAELYGNGPYHLKFHFRDNQLYSVGRYQTDTESARINYINFNLTPMSEDDIRTAIRAQLTSPQSTPGLSLNTSFTAIISPSE